MIRGHTHCETLRHGKTMSLKKRKKQKVACAHSSTIEFGIEAESSNDLVIQQQRARNRALKEKRRYLSPEM